MKNVVVFSRAFWDFNFGRLHPMRPVRVKLAYQLMEEMGLLSGASVVEPYLPPEETLLLYHTPPYIEALREEREAPEFGLGTQDNPVIPGIYRFARYAVGGTLKAVEEVTEGGVAFNLGGGMHHAHPDRASGFCYLNDVVLGIKRLRDAGKKVFYLDIDAHHCDAVQNAFYRDSSVMVVSIHQEGIFPGTGSPEELGEGEGRGYNVNVPLPRYAEDEDLLFVMEKLVIPLMRRFAPDVLFLQAGADGHKDDPLTSLYLTTGIYRRIGKMLRENLPPSVVITGGGGYDMVNVARIWSIIWATVTGREIPDRLPESFLRISIMEGYDGPGIWDVPGWSGHRQHVKDRVKEVVEYLAGEVL